MNVHPEAVFKTILQNICDDLPFTTTCVSYVSKTIHLQLEDISQDIQDATHNYVTSISTPNTYLLGTDDETTNCITEFFKYHHFYPETQYTPTSQLSSTYAPEHLAPDPRSAVTTASPTTTLAPLASGPIFMIILAPELPLSDTSEDLPSVPSRESLSGDP